MPQPLQEIRPINNVYRCTIDDTGVVLLCMSRTTVVVGRDMPAGFYCTVVNRRSDFVTVVSESGSNVLSVAQLATVSVQLANLYQAATLLKLPDGNVLAMGSS